MSAAATITSIVILSAHGVLAGAKPENRRSVFELQAGDLMPLIDDGEAEGSR
jgi:hypothetical protein